MNAKPVNITFAAVTLEVDQVLVSYPVYPYQQAFESEYLRSDLIAYVLSRIPNTYALVEETEYLSSKKAIAMIPKNDWQYIDALIREGIDAFVS